MKKSVLILFSVLFTVLSCRKEDDSRISVVVPTLTTNAISDITLSSATSGGNITDDGNGTITARGVCYSTSSNPTTSDFTTDEGTGSGRFVSLLTGLQPSTTYYVRAYATNSAGTAYGNEEQFTTNSSGSSNFPVQTVFVNGGTFMMGSPSGTGFNDEHPQHSVTLSDFYISKYEITNRQYADFMNAVNADANGVVGGVEYIDMDDNYVQISYNGNSFVANPGKENYPVVLVTWYGAKAYCEYYGGRLPTEAEWEFAALGGNNSNGYIYSGSNNLDEVAWHSGNSGNETHAVGTKNPNELGIYDMTGNAWEWCNDLYNENYYSSSPSNNPQGPITGTNRINRGGGFVMMGPNDYRVANRTCSSPFIVHFSLGFRAVFLP